MLRKTNSFSDILLQENPSNVLRRSFEGGRIAQTYLFAGKASVGRMTVAKAFAALLQCQKPVRDEKGFLDSCGQCENCRRILNNSHPDVKYITPNGNEIKIEQIRELQDSAVLKPTLGAWQIYIVDPAEKLNVSSSNALLKTLEEAPAHSLFILLASDTGAVLPTVLSRSEIVRFNAPSHQQAREILQNKFKMSPEAAASCYSLSEGNFGQSLNMAEDFEYDPEIVGIKRAHTNYLLQLQMFAQNIENDFSSVNNLEDALKKAWYLQTVSYQPLLEARKALCRSLVMNTGLPKAFPLLFSQEIVDTIDSASAYIKKSLDPILAESKKAYPAAVIKDIETQITASTTKWGSDQLEKMFLCLMNFYTDAMLMAVNADETLLLNLDRKEDIITVARVEGLDLLKSRIEMLEKSIVLLRRYIQPLLILENVMTQIGGTEA
ncbi:MAG: DNA polymerase III subunit delta' [Candidatus Riflebacteria bacterium]|nr:DNA polymerase III subunit delta' [Candidatus Riflebacteria bacterium]